MRDVSAFGTAQECITNAERLRLCSPCCAAHADTGTDLQGEYVNKDGQAYWMLLLTFPEALLRWPCEDCGEFHQRWPL